jgi:integrase/recombinase XerD
VTWDEAWEEFCEAKRLEKKGCKPNTLDQYRFALEPLRRWMLDTLKHERLEDLREQDARAYLAHVKECVAQAGRTDGQGRAHAVWRHLNPFFRWLLERGYCDTNPFAKIKIDKPDDRDRLLPELTLEHVQRLLDQTDTTSFPRHRDRVLLLFWYDTASRLSEALSVRVTEKLVADGAVKLIGKDDKEREVWLSADTRKELRPYLRARAEALKETDQPESPWLFPTVWGDRLSTRQAQERLKALGRRAGIEGVRVSPHSVRHSYALHFLREGGESLRLQSVLGHSNLAMTRRYCEQAAREVKDDMRRLSPVALLKVAPPKGRRRMRRSSEDGSASGDRG